MLFRSLSAASQSLASKPMVAVELLDSGLLDAFRAIREISSIKAGDETDGKDGVLRREAGGTNDEDEGEV